MTVIQFQERVLSIQDNMFNFALMLTANKDDAQDLLQDTTLKALDNRNKYIDNVNFKGWVMTIMRNIFINNYRKSMRNQTIFDQTKDLYHLNLSQNSGFDSPDGTTTVREINVAIDNLNNELRTPFTLFLSGYKYNEIADDLELPLGTVKSRIFFARQALQRSLQGMRN
ncbi:MAG: sigma-70 family RNA polymerase sigma factor [Dysgonamonadaceae bacterium]|nr:sigma-70 family RNA polymerase sigma factor [Dysgonamonadaceae bacterium]